MFRGYVLIGGIVSGLQLVLRMKTMKKQTGLFIFSLVLIIAGVSGCFNSIPSDGSSYDFNSFDYTKVKVTIQVDTNANGKVNFSMLKIMFPSEVSASKYFEGAEISEVVFTLHGNGEYAGEHTINENRVLPKNVTVQWFEYFEMDADDFHQELSNAVKNSQKIEWVAEGTYNLLPPQHSIPIRVSFESEIFSSN